MKKVFSIFAALVLTTAAFSFSQGMGGGMGGGNDWGNGGSGGGSGSGWGSGGGMGDDGWGGGGMGGDDWGGGSMGSGMGNGMGNGVVPADDGSLLLRTVTGDMDGNAQATLINVGPNGIERWSVDFSGEMPASLVTAGDLVILVFHSNRMDMAQDGAVFESGMTGLDLQTGQELWTTTFDGEMIGSLDFAPDASRFYVTIRETREPGSGPMNQGEGWDTPVAAQIVAFNLNGIELWRWELAG